MLPPKNDRARPVTKLCLALETFRRTDEGRVRDANAFLSHFFPRGLVNHEARAPEGRADSAGARDRLFLHIPNEVRADLLSNWGIRGKKSALRDDDEKVRSTMADALAAGDIDAAAVERGVTPEILIDWVPPEDWWSFWRGNALPLASVRKGLAIARELSLFDERWFLENLKLGTQKLTGTDVICAALTKDQIVAWMHAIHTSGSASPAGLVAALGWETILTKTAHEALLFTLDSLARQVGLASEAASEASKPTSSAVSKAPNPTAAAATPAATPVPIPAKAEVAPIVSAVPAPKPAEPTPPNLPNTSKPARASKPPLPLAASVSPTVQTSPPVASKPPPGISFAPTPAPTITTAPAPAAPISTPPNARVLFGAPPSNEPPRTVGGPPPMRPPQRTLSGVGDGFFGSIEPVPVAGAEETASEQDPAWVPPAAEPGDMGWDLVHGVQPQRPMPNNVQPKYNFTDDEPTELPGLRRQQS